MAQHISLSEHCRGAGWHLALLHGILGFEAFCPGRQAVSHSHHSPAVTFICFVVSNVSGVLLFVWHPSAIPVSNITFVSVNFDLYVTVPACHLGLNIQVL